MSVAKFAVKMTLSTTTLRIILNNVNQHKDSLVMLSVVHADCHIKALYAECHYVECHYAECHYAE